MNNKLFFLILSLAMVAFTIITICTGPVITREVPFSGIENCKSQVDSYDKNKNSFDENTKKAKKLEINSCKRRNAMHDLEYTSLIFDVIVGSICSILGLLHYFDVGKYCEKITGIIGLAGGAIGFILTIVYLGYSSYIFNNHHSREDLLYDNGAIYKWESNKYSLPYKTEDLNTDSNADKAKYKDLGKKQYNYDSESYKIVLEGGNYKSQTCACVNYVPTYAVPSNKLGDCDYLWLDYYFSSQASKNYSNKYLYDKWLTSIIFSAFTFVCAIGVAIFGLLLFLNKGDSGHTPIS